MGTATAGIAHAAIAAHLLDLPMGYVRSGSKDHGRKNQIEGKLTPGQKVVVVEDLISTGGSVLDVVDALRDAGAEVLGVVSIFTYGMPKGLRAAGRGQGVKYVSLTDSGHRRSGGRRAGIHHAGRTWPGCWPSGTTLPTKAGSEKENEPYEPSH